MQILTSCAVIQDYNKSSISHIEHKIFTTRMNFYHSIWGWHGVCRRVGQRRDKIEYLNCMFNQWVTRKDVPSGKRLLTFKTVIKLLMSLSILSPTPGY